MSFRSFDLYNLVQDFGEALTLRKVTTDGTYNPATGTLDSEATTDYSVVGYFYNYNEVLTESEIRRGNRKCVISAVGLAVDPDDQDELLGNGDTVKIVGVRTIFSNGTKLCFICDVRE